MCALQSESQPRPIHTNTHTLNFTPQRRRRRRPQRREYTDIVPFFPAQLAPIYKQHGFALVRARRRPQTLASPPHARTRAHIICICGAPLSSAIHRQHILLHSPRAYMWYVCGLSTCAACERLHKNVPHSRQYNMSATSGAVILWLMCVVPPLQQNAKGILWCAFHVAIRRTLKYAAQLTRLGRFTFTYIGR